jgi:Lrp/AsnC family transcriptional regulator, leucine-responsive regulatory protein
MTVSPQHLSSNGRGRKTNETGAVLDDTDERIIVELQKDARLTMTELGRRVNLSSPAVTERVRRLEDAGVILGYRAIVAPRAVGYPLEAFITLGSYGVKQGGGPKLARALSRFPEILEFHVVTGEDCGILRVVVEDTNHLQDLLERLAPIGRTATSIILSSPIVSRPLTPPGSREDSARDGSETE